MFVNFISSSTYFRPRYSLPDSDDEDTPLQTTNANDGDEFDEFDVVINQLVENDIRNQTARSMPAMPAIPATAALPEEGENLINPVEYLKFLGQMFTDTEKLSEKMTEEFADEVPDRDMDDGMHWLEDLSDDSDDEEESELDIEIPVDSESESE